MREELRRIQRLSVCCRVMVSDRYGVWSAVTENISARGCRIVTSRLLRRGTQVRMTFSSDLFPDDLEAAGEVAWATGEQLGVVFVGGATRAGARSPASWLNKVLEYGAMADSSTTFRVVPSVSRAPEAPVVRIGLSPVAISLVPAPAEPVAARTASDPQSGLRMTAQAPG